MRTAIALFALAVLPLGAQEIQFPASFEKLAAKAKESVNVSLDGAMMQLAGNFLSGRKSGESQAKEITKLFPDWAFPPALPFTTPVLPASAPAPA